MRHFLLYKPEIPYLSYLAIIYHVFTFCFIICKKMPRRKKQYTDPLMKYEHEADEKGYEV